MLNDLSQDEDDPFAMLIGGDTKGLEVAIEDVEEEKVEMDKTQERMEHSFKVAKTRSLNQVDRDQYVLNTTKKAVELGEVENHGEHVLKNALFYMHGHCERVS